MAAEELLVKIIGDASHLSGELDKASGKIDGFIGQIGKIGKNAASIGIAIESGFAVAYKTFTDYETRLVDMGKVTGESAESIQEKIQRLDPILGNMTELMEGYYQVISAGVTDPIKALELLETAAQTAKAAHVEQSEVVKGITKVMAGYGDEIKTASDAADLFFAIEKEGQTAVNELIPIIGGLANVSNQLSIEANEMGGALALITRTAGSTADAATQYEAVLTGLIKPTQDMQDLIHGLGYESAQHAIAEEGLVEVLKRVKEATGGNIEVLGQLFGRKEAIVGFTALSADNFGTLEEIIGNVSEKTGKANEAFDAWSATGQAAMDQVQSSLSNLSITIGEAVAPMFTEFINQVSDIIQRVTEWARENPELVETIAKIGVILAVGGTVLMGLAALASAIRAIGTIGAVATPLGALALGITTIVVIWQNWDKIVEFVQMWSEKIVGFLTDLKDMAIQKVQEMIDWIIQKFEDLANLPKKMLDWGKNAVSGFAEGIKNSTSKVFGNIEDLGQGIKDRLGFQSPPKIGPLSTSDKWMPNMMEMFATGIGAGIPAIASITAEVGETINDNISETADNVVKTTENMMDDMGKVIEEKAIVVIEPTQNFASNFMTIFENLKNDFKSKFVTPVIEYIQDQLAGAIYGLLTNASEFEWSWKTFWEGLKEILISAVAAMIAKLIVLASFSWLFNLIGLPLSWLGINKGGEVGYEKGGQTEYLQFGGPKGTDIIPAWLSPGEYVIAKPMVDFIKRFKAIPGELTKAISIGMPTPMPAFAGGGLVGNVSAGSFGTIIHIDIHDNKISDDVDIKKLANTVSNEIVKKLGKDRRF